jgi:hypothetical protein
MWLKRSRETEPSPERLYYSRYYEHDGALRAYANRAMLLALLSIPTALVAVCLAAYVRLQPPTLIRVDSTGASQLVKAAAAAAPPLPLFQNGSEEPTDFEKRASVRLFLERYLNFSPGSVNQNLALALNMMTANLRRSSLAAMEKDNTVGRVLDEQITSVFHLRSLEAAKDDPLRFTAFGVKQVHRVHDHQETSESLVGQFEVRLISERRSEQNPSGLLIAGYGERLIAGERQESGAGPALNPPAGEVN